MPEHSLEIIPKIVIPTHLVSQVQSRLAYIDEHVSGVSISADGTRIKLRVGNSAGKKALVGLEEKVQLVVAEMAKGTPRPKVEVLEDYLDRTVPFVGDPLPELITRGEVSQEYSGVFSFGPLITRLIEVFESYFLELAANFEAELYRFPALISAEKLGRVNYFRAFPHSLTFATHLREDLDVINDFSEHAAHEPNGLNTAPTSFSRIQTLLSPAVCYHLYFALADKSLTAGKLVATAAGHCFRYESNNLNSLERLWDFTMREIIFVGPADFVLENRKRAQKLLADWLGRIGMAYKVESANDPFFVGEFRKQAAFQNAFQLKYEIRALLPFKDDTLAIGSYNYHQDFFGRHLNIILPNGKPAHTGCAAFGLERLAYAFLSQFGVESAAWPELIRDAME